VKIFDIFGAALSPPAPIEVKIYTAKLTQVPVGHAKFDVNRCKESPLRGEKPDFWPVSKFNTGSLPLRSILPVTSLYLISDSAVLHPFKRSGNHSSKLTRAESLKARKRFLMVIIQV